MPASKSAAIVARELIDAFCAADTQRMRTLLADDLRAYITNRDGGVDEVGLEEYLQRVVAMDLPSVQFTFAVTQTVAPRPGMIIAMVEVNAARDGNILRAGRILNDEDENRMTAPRARTGQSVADIIELALDASLPPLKGTPG